MGDMDFLVAIFGILIVLVPVTGLTAVLTLRYGGRPFVETLARELRGVGALQDGGAQRSVEELTEQVEALTREVERLSETRSFDERLLGDRGGAGRE